MSDELARLIAVTHKTMRQEFRNVLMIPAGRIVMLASDGPLTARIADRLEAHAIRTRLLHRRFLDDLLAPLRMADLRRAVSESAPVNRDFSPILYYYHLRYWMSQFRVGFGLLEAALAVLTLVCLFPPGPSRWPFLPRGSPPDRPGSRAAGRLPDSLWFRLPPGEPDRDYVYGRAGDRLAGDDAIPGSLDPQGSGLARSGGGGLCGRAAGGPAGLSRLGSEAAVRRPIVIPLLALLLAVLVGLTFPLAGKADFRTVTSTTARLYTADYLGAALGLCCWSARC